MQRTFLSAVVVVFCIFTSATKAVIAEPFTPAPSALDSFDAGTLHVDKFGSGSKTLLLIPGFTCGPWEWYGTIVKFSPRYTIYVLTLPGFNGRPATKETPLIDAFKRDFWALLEKQKMAKPVVIGHSLGGTLAFALAIDHPEKLAGIIAIDGLPVFPTTVFATQEQRAAMANQMASMYQSFSPSQMFESAKSYMSSIGTNRPEFVEPSAKLQATSDPNAAANWLREDLSMDLRPSLPKITIPVLEIVPFDPNAGSPYTQQQTVDFYKSIIAAAPHAKVGAVVPARHFVMFDQPEKFYKITEGFLRRLESAAGH